MKLNNSIDLIKNVKLTLVFTFILTYFYNIEILAVTPQREIVAGKRIGNVSIGDRQTAVRKKNGRPTLSDKEGRYLYESFGSSKNENLVSVTYKDGKVIQIQTIYPIFQTKEGVRRESLWPLVKKFYPSLKVFSLGDKERDPEHIFNHYVDNKRGISFLMDNSGWPPAIDKDTGVFSITIFCKNSGPLVRVGDSIRKLQ